jgi:hypothetical protein
MHDEAVLVNVVWVITVSVLVLQGGSKKEVLLLEGII